MKDLLNAIEKDYKSENFTKLDWMVYGLILPAILVLIYLLAD